MYSRFLTFQWRLMFNAYYSPVGVTILTNVYCYGNLTGLSGNRVYFGEGKTHPIRARRIHFNGAQTISAAHFSGVQRSVV